MKLRSRNVSLRALLVGFTAFICVVIAGFFALNVWHEYGVAVSVNRRAAVNLAESLAQQASDTFEAVDGVLLALVGHIESDGTGPAQRAELQASMAALVTTMPRLHALLVVDAGGRLVASNSSAAPRPDLTFAGLPAFRYHRAHPGAGLRISAAVRAQTEDAWVIEVTRRLNGRDGRFAGIAIAQVAVSYFEQRFANVDVGRRGAIALISDDQTIVVRRPRVQPGKSVRRSAIFSGPLQYDWSGTYAARSVVDGVRRLFAFRRLDAYPFVVQVSFAESEYLADWRSDVVANVLALFAVLALIVGFAAGLAAQIERRRRAENSLAEMALVDGLTGLANRRQFDAALEREWRHAVRDHVPLALLMLDVDHFKAYNDRYGHLNGDKVLGSIARTIGTHIVRPRDLAARYGGEEFAVILPGIDASSALVVAERIRGAIAALAIEHADSAGSIVSVSIGAASAGPVTPTGRADLIAAADDALYDAKRSGRNRTALAARDRLPG